MQLLIDNLKANNLKVTPQRLTIYNYLYNNQTHPSAETIYNDIKSDNHTISLATVYKTLKSLKDAYLIKEINIGEDSFRYDANIDSHSHIICKKCKKILDYYHDENILKLLKNEIQKYSNFEIETEQTYFYGLCDCCKNN